MGFEDALRSQLPVKRVGQVELFFEGSLYWGEEQRPRRAPRADAAYLAALALGVLALGTLLVNGSAWTAGSSAVLAALAVGYSISERQRVRGRRAFALNFGTESLRLDGPEGLFHRPATRTLHFDAIEDLEVVPRPGGFGLEVAFRDEGGLHRRLLVEAPADEVDALRRLWNTLRNAFGLRPPAV